MDAATGSTSARRSSREGVTGKALLAVALAVVATLAACGGGDPEDNERVTTDPADCGEQRERCV